MNDIVIKAVAMALKNVPEANGNMFLNTGINACTWLKFWCMNACTNSFMKIFFNFLLQLNSDIYISDSCFIVDIHISLLECRERRSRFMWFCWYINCSCYREGILPLFCSLAFIWISGNNKYKEKMGKISILLFPDIIWVQGLMTPIVRNADQKTISAISIEVF